MSVVRAMATGTLVVVGLSLFDDANVFSFTLLFYTPLVGVLVASAALIHRGSVSVVGWATSLLLWATVSVALVFFGGLESNSAMAFIVAMTVAGSVVSGRAAV
nr:hypothetical protein [Myxococcaceae bacterium]